LHIPVRGVFKYLPFASCLASKIPS